MQTTRSILSALGLVAVIFGIPVVATLAASQFGYSPRMTGWLTLVTMIVLTFQFRALLGRLLLGGRKLAPVAARRPFKRVR